MASVGWLLIYQACASKPERCLPAHLALTDPPENAK
jgi:hypothetical protein